MIFNKRSGLEPEWSVLLPFKCLGTDNELTLGLSVKVGGYERGMGNNIAAVIEKFVLLPGKQSAAGW